MATDSDSIQLWEHPDFSEEKKEWNTLRVLRDGDHDELTSEEYLWPHEIESAPNGGPKLRAIRALRSQYSNMIEPVESTWTSLIVKEEAQIPNGIAALLGENVDGEGHGLISFLRDSIAPDFILYGKTIVLIDSYDLQAKSKAEEKALGLKPFMRVLSPLDVKDWQWSAAAPDTMRKLQSVRYEYYQDEPRELTEKPDRALYSKLYKLIDVGAEKGVQVTTFKAAEIKDGVAKWKVVDVKTLALDEIPVVVLESESWLRQLIGPVTKLFNLESSLDCQLNTQAFQRIIVATDADDKAKLAFSEYTVNFISEGSTVHVIEPSNPQSLERRIESTLRQIGKIAFNQGHSLAADSKEAPSADSTRKMKEEQLALALSAIGDLEMLINAAIRIFAKFMSQTETEKVILSRDLTEEDIAMQVQLFQAHIDSITKVPRWHKACLKQVVEEQNLPEAEEIKADIEATDFRPKEINTAPYSIGMPTKKPMDANNEEDLSEDGDAEQDTEAAPQGN